MNYISPFCAPQHVALLTLLLLAAFNAHSASFCMELELPVCQMRRKSDCDRDG
jgi:hypothetical protein